VPPVYCRSKKVVPSQVAGTCDNSPESASRLSLFSAFSIASDWNLSCIFVSEKVERVIFGIIATFQKLERLRFREAPQNVLRDPRS